MYTRCGDIADTRTLFLCHRFLIIPAFVAFLPQHSFFTCDCISHFSFIGHKNNNSSDVLLICEAEMNFHHFCFVSLRYFHFYWFVCASFAGNIWNIHNILNKNSIHSCWDVKFYDFQTLDTRMTRAMQALK